MENVKPIGLKGITPDVVLRRVLATNPTDVIVISSNSDGGYAIEMTPMNAQQLGVCKLVFDAFAIDYARRMVSREVVHE